MDNDTKIDLQSLLATEHQEAGVGESCEAETWAADFAASGDGKVV